MPDSAATHRTKGDCLAPLEANLCLAAAFFPFAVRRSSLTSLQPSHVATAPDSIQRADRRRKERLSRGLTIHGAATNADGQQ
jgi:hypothetical protein